MKKFTAILISVLVVFSAMSLMVSAADDSAPKYVCDFCDEEFATLDLLKAHIEAYFPVQGHQKACGNWYDKNNNGVKDDGEVCTEVFHTKAAYEAHQAECLCLDKRTDFDLAKEFFAAGDYANALKKIVAVIVAFVETDDFKNAVNKVIDTIKGIDFNSIINNVKGVVEKLPIDKIKDLF